MDNDKLTPRQASDLLGIGTETLKKYASLLEHNGHFIGRNGRQHRYYNGTDIGLLRAMLTLNRDKSVTLEDAASIVTSADTDIKAILNETGATVTDTGTSTEVSTGIPLHIQEEIYGAFTERMFENVAEINTLRLELELRDKEHSDFMQNIATKLDIQKETIDLLREEVELLRKQAAEKPSSFWSRLFGK